MSNKDQVRRLLQNKLSQKQNIVSVVVGVLGDGSGNVTDTSKPCHVFVRISGIVTSVFNVKVPPENDLRVLVGNDPTQPNLTQVLSTFTSSPGGTIGGGMVGYAPASQYEWMGPDPIFIDKRLLLPRRISTYSGMQVKMYADMFRMGDEWIALPETTIDLISYIPDTVGKMVLVLITLDNSGTIILTASSSLDIATAVPADIPGPPTGTSDVLAVVRCYYGQTAVQEAISNFDILDLRFTYFGPGGGTIADHDHSGDAGDGGQFPLINLQSTGANSGQVPTADGSGGIVWDTVSKATEYFDGDVSNPPTHAEITAVVGGEPWVKGAGYSAIINDNAEFLNEYLVISDGLSWSYFALSKAVSSLATGALVRQGTVLSAETGDNGNVYEASILYENNPQILTQYKSIFKMWYGSGWGSTQINYAESPDGINWTPYNGNPVASNHMRPNVVHDGSVYYLYAANNSDTNICVATSSDGLSWSSFANILGPDPYNPWKTANLANSYTWKEGSTWYMLYEAKGTVWALGLATSTDGLGWTDYVSNPVVTEIGSRSGPWVGKIGSIYYLICHGSTSGVLPTDIYRYHSTDLHSWVSDGTFLTRLGTDEGYGVNTGQVADPMILIINGVLYLWYEATPDGTQQSGAQHIKLATGAAHLLSD